MLKSQVLVGNTNCTIDTANITIIRPITACIIPCLASFLASLSSAEPIHFIPWRVIMMVPIPPAAE